MKYLAMILVTTEMLTGLIAAWFWYLTSKVVIDSGWATEPLDTELAQMGWLTGIMDAAKKSADLNKIAAIWTAVSIILNAAYSFVSFLAAN